MGSVLVFIFVCIYLCVLSRFAIILTRKRELVALLCLSLWRLVTFNVLWLFLTVGLQCVIVVFPDHRHLLIILRFDYL